MKPKRKDYEDAYLKLCRQVDEKPAHNLSLMTDMGMLMEYNRVLAKFGCLTFSNFEILKLKKQWAKNSVS